MTGTVDDFGRALIRVILRHPDTGAFLEGDAWVDTAFTGDLLLPQQLIAQLNLPQKARIGAGLGDGSRTSFVSYRCMIDWFGKPKAIEALASASRLPLVGVSLLQDHVVTADYPNRTVHIQ